MDMDSSFVMEEQDMDKGEAEPVLDFPGTKDLEDKEGDAQMDTSSDANSIVSSDSGSSGESQMFDGTYLGYVDPNNKFTGYSKEAQTKMTSLVDVRSDSIYNLYRKACLASISKMLSPTGVLRLRNLEKRGKLFLIHPSTFEAYGSQLKEQAEKRKTKKKMESMASRKITKDNENTIKPPDLPPVMSSSATSTPRLEREIRTPKRYQGNENNQKLSKKPTGYQPLPKDKNLYQIGMLPPKYPKSVEIIKQNGFWSLSLPDFDGNLAIHGTGGVAPMKNKRIRKNKNQVAQCGLFQISYMHHSGELERVISDHQLAEENRIQQILLLEQVWRQQQQEAEKERVRLEQERVRQELETKQRLELKRLQLQKEQERLEVAKRRKQLQMLDCQMLVDMLTSQQTEDKLMSYYEGSTGQPTNCSTGKPFVIPKKVVWKPRKDFKVTGPIPKIPILTGKTFKKQTYRRKRLDVQSSVHSSILNLTGFPQQVRTEVVHAHVPEHVEAALMPPPPPPLLKRYPTDVQVMFSKPDCVVIQDRMSNEAGRCLKALQTREDLTVWSG